jgi:hypothetical protein
LPVGNAPVSCADGEFRVANQVPRMSARDQLAENLRCRGTSGVLNVCRSECASGITNSIGCDSPMKRYQLLLPVSPFCAASRSASHNATVLPRRFRPPLVRRGTGRNERQPANDSRAGCNAQAVGERCLQLDAFKPKLTRAEADIRIAMLKAKLKLLDGPPHTL